MSALAPTIPHSTLQKYSELNASFKRGNYLDVIARAFLYEPSLLAFHYLSLSCKKVNAPLELIEYINFFLSSQTGHQPEPATKASHIDYSTTNIPAVDQLLTARQVADDPLKAKRIVIEGFIFDNPLLFILHTKLSTDQRILLSNLMNILGDTYRLQGKLRAALESLKLATQLFPDSFYSRVNYADLAYNLNDISLCLVNLKHANHLLYHSRMSGNNHVYDPHNNVVAPANELVLRNFFSLSWRCGFLPR